MSSSENIKNKKIKLPKKTDKEKAPKARKKLTKKQIIIISSISAVVVAAAVVATVLFVKNIKKSGQMPNGMNGFNPDGLVTATGTTTTGMVTEELDLDFLETSLEVEEVYIHQGETVEAGSKVLKITDESLEKARKELEREAESAEYKYRAQKITAAEDEIDAKATYDKNEAKREYASQEYEDSIRDYKNTIDSLQTELGKLNDLVTEYTAAVTTDYYYTYFDIDAKKKQLTENFEYLNQLYEDWGIEAMTKANQAGANGMTGMTNANGSMPSGSMPSGQGQQGQQPSVTPTPTPTADPTPTPTPTPTPSPTMAPSASALTTSMDQATMRALNINQSYSYVNVATTSGSSSMPSGASGSMPSGSMSGSSSSGSSTSTSSSDFKSAKSVSSSSSGTGSTGSMPSGTSSTSSTGSTSGASGMAGGTSSNSDKLTAYNLFDAEVTEESNEYKTAMENYEELMQLAASNLAKATAAVTELQAELTQAQVDYETAKLTAEQTLNETIASCDLAEDTYNTEIERIHDELADYENKYEDARDNLAYFEEKLGDGYFYTSSAGDVMVVMARADQSLSGTSFVMAYTDAESLSVEVSVDQANIAALTVGETATVSINGSTYKGTVVAINPVTNSSSRSSVYYTVNVTLEGDVSTLSENMTATVIFGTNSANEEVPADVQ